MNLVARPAMTTAAIMGMAAIPSAVVVATADVLAMRALPRRRQNHPSKKKRHHANEHQQQNSEMYPTGLGHPISPLFARPGRQSDSTMWM